jgi:hypothetical protein
MHLEVMGPSHMKHGQGFGQGQHMLPEGFHLGPAVLAELYGDQGLKAHAQGLRGHLGVSPQENAQATQSLDAGQAGGWSQTYGGRQFLVGQPSIIL